MPWYKDFFEKWYLKFWLSQERFKPAYVKKEVAFIKRVLGLSKGAKILDLCCGHGRHLLPLAKVGYRMTGQGLSQKALKILNDNAKKQKLDVRIVRSDMRRIPFENEFDAVINMFTAFGYLENDREDFKVLKQVAKALKPGGKFLIDLTPKDWILNNYQPKSWMKEGKYVILEERTYNPKTSRNLVKNEVIDGRGRRYKFINDLRLYSLDELKSQLQRAGLKIIDAFGDLYSGEKYKKTSKRLIVLAEKR